MKILIAPQAFKGTFSAHEAAEAIASGVRRIDQSVEITTLPIADGGDGTLEVLSAKIPMEMHHIEAHDPLGRRISVPWGWISDSALAFIEMAKVSGLALLKPEERNPLRSATFGLGELIRAILDQGAKKVFIGLGGSATNDGGAGMAQALGYQLLDAEGVSLEPGGGSLSKLQTIVRKNAHRGIRDTEWIIGADVMNPLLGPQGATRMYGPQKGATPEMVLILEQGLSQLAHSMQRDLGIDVNSLQGGGAAGGTAAGCAAFLGGTIVSGSEWILDALAFDQVCSDCDLLITGEGKLDRQTVFSKAPMAAFRRAQRQGVTVLLLAGSKETGWETGWDPEPPIVFTGEDLSELRLQDLTDLAADGYRKFLHAKNG